MNKQIAGLVNQQGGLAGEKIIKDMLKTLGYKVTQPPQNTPAFDLVAIKDNIGLLIQVKTDVNGNGKFPKPTKVQKNNLIKLAKKIGYVPILINCDPKNNKYQAINMDGTIRDLEI